jgi:uncharacterized protein YceK
MRKIILSVVIVSILTSGCSAFAPKTQTVNAACSEADATLQVNGGQTYTGQAQIEARRDRVFSYACLKQGYYPAQKTVSYSISPTGIADFVGSMLFIIPIIGIFTPGAWDLDETDVTINMVRY